MAIIRYLGHSFFEVVLLGLDGAPKTILMDPWVENPQSPVKLDEYRDKKVDYIIVTHDHGDHIGNAIELAKLTNAQIIGIYEIASYAGQQGVKGIGGNIGGFLKIPDLGVVLTPAFHSSNRGAPTGVIVIGQDIRLYHAGDTGLFSEMTLLHELYNIDVALLPIGGHFTMGVREAVKAVELLKPRITIPMHYNTFPVIQADPYEFKKLVEEKTNTKVVILKPGEIFKYP